MEVGGGADEEDEDEEEGLEVKDGGLFGRVGVYQYCPSYDLLTVLLGLVCVFLAL